jgi:hypothetical protein
MKCLDKNWYLAYVWKRADVRRWVKDTSSFGRYVSVKGEWKLHKQIGPVALDVYQFQCLMESATSVYGPKSSFFKTSQGENASWEVVATFMLYQGGNWALIEKKPDCQGSWSDPWIPIWVQACTKVAMPVMAGDVIGGLEDELRAKLPAV